jgi:hypothetical protein
MKERRIGGEWTKHGDSRKHEDYSEERAVWRNNNIIVYSIGVLQKNLS